eukprot:Rmarinus@m.1087
MSNLEDLILDLHRIGAVKFGTFKLKSGISSPIYIDLRLLISFPKIMKNVTALMWEQCRNLKVDVICGAPYAAIPFASAISVMHDVPMVMRRKEVKSYGTKKAIEGHITRGSRCVVFEDLVSSGISVFETIEPLNEVGLEVVDVIAVLDREHGGRQNLEKRGIHLHTLTNMSQVLTVLEKHEKLDRSQVTAVKQFMAENQVTPLATDQNTSSPVPKEMTWSARAELSQNAIAKKLFHLMESKKSNLCVAADVSSMKELITLAKEVGPYICLLKTHIDALDDFSLDGVRELEELSQSAGFLLFEDRKFGDIGATVMNQYTSGVYHIAEWAHITNAHPVPGPGIISGLKKGADKSGKDRALLLVAEMSSEGSLAVGPYTKEAVKMAKENAGFVTGFIAQNKLVDDPQFIHMTPGVKLEKGGDGLGQQYNSPKDVIAERKMDIIIVGRGITQAQDRVEAASTYQRAGYDAYLSRLGKSKT